ncbi:unnamed protein product [Ceratitis capitata]|uniref:(Mediterranean fruit fly) hypothetical protein n=1 Tax=Ceratitis capitata TaxID=7213 RepID=A0A811UP69_CERCA|nr:unnamed protein product [Ceratitis capitata]
MLLAVFVLLTPACLFHAGTLSLVPELHLAWWWQRQRCVALQCATQLAVNSCLLLLCVCVCMCAYVSPTSFFRPNLFALPCSMAGCALCWLFHHKRAQKSVLFSESVCCCDAVTLTMLHMPNKFSAYIHACIHMYFGVRGSGIKNRYFEAYFVA